MIKELPIVNKIPHNHAIRGKFAGKSTTDAFSYYPTKGHAINTFDSVLQDYDLQLSREDMDFYGDSGWKIIHVVNEYNMVVGYAHLSWYRMESGNYEFTGYIS